MLPVISQADLNEITFDVFSTHGSASHCSMVIACRRSARAPEFAQSLPLKWIRFVLRGPRSTLPGRALGPGQLWSKARERTIRPRVFILHVPG